MFKSIFVKYFSVVSLAICLSFLTLAAVQSFVSARYWLDEKEQLFTESAQKIAESAADFSRSIPGDESRYTLYLDRDSTLPAFADLLSATLDADVLITDNRGVLLMRTQMEAGGQGYAVLPDEVTAALQERDSYFSVEQLDGIYDERQYVAAAPIVKNGMKIGYLVIAAPAGDMADYLWKNLRIFLMSAVVVLILVAVAAYFFAYRLSMPLRKMAAAAKAFGSGDFSTRLPEQGKDEVAELARELNNMAESLSREEEMSRFFVANVSHELRTPMTTISGFVDGMRDGTIPPEKHNYYLSIVSDEVRRLSRLVQAMLNLSRIDNQSLKIHPTDFDLTALTGKTLLSFEQRIEAKRLHIVGLENCDSVRVTADEDLIGQVVYNLIDNAVKFTNEEGEIALSVSEAAGRVVFTIRNTGDGIPSEELPYIFDRFYKSDRSRSLDKNGAGLGLFLVKSIIGLQNGEIAVRSVQGEFCTFEFWLPVIHGETV